MDSKPGTEELLRLQIRELNDQNKEYRIEREKLIGELADLHRIINSPETEEFLLAVKLEAAHQRSRWGSENDAGKEDIDWFWLLGWLGSKAVTNPGTEGASKPIATTKKKHRIITVAAACLNWHMQVSGQSSDMRPGIPDDRYPEQQSKE